MNDRSSARFMLNPRTTRTQYGALCWRLTRGVVQILLITSRDTGRWVIPKGWPMPELSPELGAAREAWEEAGVEGVVSPDCIGLFSYDKDMGPDMAIPCVVAVYPLRVTRLAGKFPERKQRRRKWFSIDQAASRVVEPELRAIIATFVPPTEQVETVG